MGVQLPLGQQHRPHPSLLPPLARRQTLSSPLFTALSHAMVFFIVEKDFYTGVCIKREENERWSKGHVVQEKWESCGKKDCFSCFVSKSLVSFPPLQVTCQVLQASEQVLTPTHTLE